MQEQKGLMAYDLKYRRVGIGGRLPYKYINTWPLQAKFHMFLIHCLEFDQPNVLLGLKADFKKYTIFPEGNGTKVISNK